jgi:hypothetical protein
VIVFSDPYNKPNYLTIWVAGTTRSESTFLRVSPSLTFAEYYPLLVKISAKASGNKMRTRNAKDHKFFSKPLSVLSMLEAGPIEAFPKTLKARRTHPKMVQRVFFP